YVRGNSRFARETGGANYIEFGSYESVNKITSDDEGTNQKDFVIEVVSPDDSYQGTNWNRSFSIATGRKGSLARRLLITGETGFVGIGSGVPSEKLDVQGNLKASGTAIFGNRISAYDLKFSSNESAVYDNKGNVKPPELENLGSTFWHIANDEGEHTIRSYFQKSHREYPLLLKSTEIDGNLKASGSAEFEGYLNAENASFGRTTISNRLYIQSTGLGETLRILGPTEGNENNNVIGFYESNGEVRQGFIGFNTKTNTSMALSNNVGDLFFWANGVNMASISDTGLSINGNLETSGSAELDGSLAVNTALKEGLALYVRGNSRFAR
ncbi:hypothetical protein, partial [Xanthovirga aplysinae]|uniref:hypothetical protein n=1 Tax=Xanthovirga aplysinae TaxID=2529853 RepID=UPI0016573BC7